MASMATTPVCLGAIARPSMFSKSCLRAFSALAPLYAPRSGANLSKEKAAKEKAKKRKKKHTMYKQYDLRDAEQFTLCDAIRFVLEFGLEICSANYRTDTFEPSKWENQLQDPSTNVISSSKQRKTALLSEVKCGCLTPSKQISRYA